MTTRTGEVVSCFVCLEEVAVPSLARAFQLHLPATPQPPKTTARSARLLPPTVPLETLLFPADRAAESVEGRFCIALYLPDRAQVAGGRVYVSRPPS